MLDFYFHSPVSQSFISCPINPTEKNPASFKIISRPEFDEKIKDLKSAPWYIILDNNQGCRFIAGATEVIANRRLDYECNDGVSLFLPLKEDSKKLQIGCSNGDRIESCDIKEAWY